MSVLVGDCVEVMAVMEPDSVDAIVTDAPYGLEFMGKEWDRLWHDKPSEFAIRPNGGFSPFTKKRPTYQAGPTAQAWHQQWAAAAIRVAKPGAYLLAFGGTRTVHRMTCALEDAGWVIRDMLVWAYASGFPKSRASLKPAWEPIVLCRKPGASRDLNIDASRIEYENAADLATTVAGAEAMKRSIRGKPGMGRPSGDGWARPWEQDADAARDAAGRVNTAGRWPANVILTDPIFDGGWDGVVGGGESQSGIAVQRNGGGGRIFDQPRHPPPVDGGYTDTGTYSRFFLIPKAPTSERVLSDGRRSPHPTQKPEALIRHLVRLVTPAGGLVLDPFLGSGTLGVVCDGLGIRWLGIEREPEYVQWAEDRIADGRPRWEIPA
jgi:DNA modification methylase